MDRDQVLVGIVVGTAVGIISAKIGSATLDRLKEDVHNDELEEAGREGFRKGWSEASNSATNIQRRYQEMFGTPDEGGTALKS